MKTFKHFITITMVCFLMITNFVGCKKGDGDPFLSLHSRKARVVGKWKLDSGTATEKTTNSGVTTTISITYTDSKETLGTNSLPYTEEIEFKKDGGFSITIAEDGEIAIISGNWNFTGNVGDYKKKEQIVLNITSDVSNGSSTTYAGNSNIQVFDIYELKNKEMVLKSLDSESEDGDTDETSTEKTYKQ